jgi:DNA polymerase epsilon subunit 1
MNVEAFHEGIKTLSFTCPLQLVAQSAMFSPVQLTMPEADWQANINQLSLQLLAAGARGVYESQLPLAASAALSLGCVVTVAPAARRRPLGEGFDLHELQMRTTTQYTYLEGSGPDGLGLLRYAALYHSTDSLGQRSTFCLLLPAAGKVLVQVVARHALGAKEVTPLIVERAWRDIMEQLQPGNNTQEQVGDKGTCIIATSL